MIRTAGEAGNLVLTFCSSCKLVTTNFIGLMDSCLLMKTNKTSNIASSVNIIIFIPTSILPLVIKSP